MSQILDDDVGFAGLHQLIKRKRLLPSVWIIIYMRIYKKVNYCGHYCSGNEKGTAKEL